MDRFDIVHAHYVFNVLNHSGQGCPMYERQCRISGYYRPSPLHEDKLENEEQVEIYDALAEKHGCPNWEESERTNND